MTWHTVPAREVRRRAVVSGRVVDGAGRPYARACTLALVRLKPERRFAGQMRAGGCFFFLDVPPGRYTLDRCDAAGAVVQTKKLVVPAYTADTRMPVMNVDVEIVDPAGSPAASPPQLKGT